MRAGTLRPSPPPVLYDHFLALVALYAEAERAKLEMAVLVVPPRSGTSKTYDQARYVFDQLKVRPVVEKDVRTWATK